MSLPELTASGWSLISMEKKYHFQRCDWYCIVLVFVTQTLLYLVNIRKLVNGSKSNVSSAEKNGTQSLLHCCQEQVAQVAQKRGADDC